MRRKARSCACAARLSVPPPTHVVRARIHGRAVYLVPRADGIVIGATQYETGDLADRTPQAGGVADLLSDAVGVMPGLRTYELTEAAACAPAPPTACRSSNGSTQTQWSRPGNGRNGIVLAPLTAHRVVAILEEKTDDHHRDGEPLGIEGEVSVADVVTRLGLPDRGIAVAVDGAVVPRGRWAAHTVTSGAVVEIVTAVQGG